jgi:hypothetical protein
MSDSTVQFITQMKLRELHRQRAKLREAYGRLGEEIARAEGPAQRLHKLSDDLRGLTFAGRPLHPDVANLDVLLFAADAGALSADVLALWLGRLEDELAAGRLRAEFVYLFGALLEEWAREAPEDERLAAEGREAQGQLLREALAAPAPDRHAEVIGPLFDGLGPVLADLSGRLRDLCREVLHSPVGTHELSRVLDRIAADIYRGPRLRREARRFKANELLRKELADALTILVADLPTWDWPAEGLKTRALWTRNKWRLYLDEDLPTACLLEVLGGRWVSILDSLIGDRSKVHERRARLKKLIELNAPEVILANERRMLRLAEQLVDLGFSERDDVWEAGGAADLAKEPDAGSVVVTRAAQQRALRKLAVGRDYDGEYDDVNRAVLLVNAEVRLARAAFPDRPLYVVKVDVQDYHPSIPHGVLLALLRRLGAPEDELAFFGRFLSPPLAGEDGPPARMRRGVPMNHTLSGMLGELLMRLLEKHAQQQARVRIVRLVDDICLLAPEAGAAVEGWRQVEAFCAACGLRVNLRKSGAVCLGGALPEGLPRERPRWGMLELDEQGQWHVHAETFEAHRKQSRQRVGAARSVLSRVQRYNGDVKYLLSSLALGADLGETHRAEAERAVRQFHLSFFGTEQGVVAGLCEAIRERFLPAAGDPADIPESWVHWPITAGGLGLRNPVLVAGQYAGGFRGRRAPALPETREPGWNVHVNPWAAYYQHFLNLVPPAEPSENRVMKTLLEDFIARGKEISAGGQEGLGAYWRWVLCTYGPQILQRFGTFRFLITELVPLQLISRQLVQDSSLGGERPAPGRDTGEEIPF